MATVTTKSTGVTFVVEISTAEAQYVAAALLGTEPTYLAEDTVYDALTDAMVEAGVKYDNSAVKS